MRLCARLAVILSLVLLLSGASWAFAEKAIAVRQEQVVTGADELTMKASTFDGLQNGTGFAPEDSSPSAPQLLEGLLSAKQEPDEECKQHIENSQFDVVANAAEPWYVLDPAIYYFHESDGTGLAYDGHSVVLPDGDEGDPTPASDILAQVVVLDHVFNEVTVAYEHGTLDGNPADRAFVEIWRLDPEGKVDLSQPRVYRAQSWEVSESEGTWSPEAFTAEGNAIAQLSGEEVALLLRTVTDGGGTEEKEMEWMLFDDVTLTTCYREIVVVTYDLFLPLLVGES